MKFSKFCNDKDELVDGILDAIKKDTPSNGREKIKELEISLEDMGKKIVEIYEGALKD